MKITLSQCRPSEEAVFSGVIDPLTMDVESQMMHFQGPVDVTAKAMKIDHDLTIDLHIKGMRRFVCSKCLEEFNNLFEKHQTLHYDIHGLDSIVLDEELRDELFLDHPIRVLCKSDCKGLCAGCGTNLNKEKCRCAH